MGKLTRGSIQDWVQFKTQALFEEIRYDSLGNWFTLGWEMVNNEVVFTYLFIFFQFCVVYLSDLCKFCPIVGVFYSVICSWSAADCLWRCACRWWSTTLLWSCYTFCYQHVVQAHQLGVWGLFFLWTTNTQNWKQREVNVTLETAEKWLHKDIKCINWGIWDLLWSSSTQNWKQGEE